MDLVHLWVPRVGNGGGERRGATLIVNRELQDSPWRDVEANRESVAKTRFGKPMCRRATKSPGRHGLIIEPRSSRRNRQQHLGERGVVISQIGERGGKA